MTPHQAAPILPCNDIDATRVFCEHLGFVVTGGDPGFRILTDGRGWQAFARYVIDFRGMSFLLR